MANEHRRSQTGRESLAPDELDPAAPASSAKPRSKRRKRLWVLEIVYTGMFRSGSYRQKYETRARRDQALETLQRTRASAKGRALFYVRAIDPK